MSLQIRGNKKLLLLKKIEILINQLFDIGRIKRVRKFKYLGKIIQEDGLLKIFTIKCAHLKMRK